MSPRRTTKVKMMMTRIIINVTSSLLLLQVLLVLFSHAQKVDEPRNHLFRFINFKNGFGENVGKAKEELANILKSVSSQNVSLVSLNDTYADWFSEDINNKEGCPEEAIRQLLSRIKESDTGDFTRNFKLAVTENFALQPEFVQIDWRGPCTQYGRKRSQVGIEPLNDERLQLLEDDTPGNNISDSSSSIPSLINSDASSTTIGIPTTSTEPSAPTTTTDPPTATPEILTPEPQEDNTTSRDASNDPEMNNFSTTATTEGSLFVMSDLDSLFTSEPSAPITTTTIVATTTTTTSKAATNPPTTSRPDSETQKPLELDTTTRGGTNNGEMTTIDTLTTQSNLDNASRELKNESTTQIYYGKYIGLGAAFAIAVAYFVYSRAYKRQGMYELQH